MSQEYVKTENGLMPIPVGFDEVEYLSNSLFKVRKDGKYGICNSIGKIIIDITNDEIEFLNSTIIVTYNDIEITVYNHKGERILEDIKGYVGSIFAINEYMFLYGTSLYNLKGELIWKIDVPVYKPEFFEGVQSSSFLKVHSDATKEGVLSIDGKIIVPCNYKEITYKEGYFIVENYNQFTECSMYGAYDIMGNHILEDKYSKISIQNNGFIAIDNEKCTNRFWYLLDSCGQVIYTASDIAPTGNGMYVVSTWNQKQRKHLDGVIDSCGNEILPCSYHRIEAYKDGFFYISRDNYGRCTGQLDVKYINCEGVRKLSLAGNIEVANGEEKILLPSDYNWATDFVNGLAIVRNNSGVGVIDTNLNVVVNACYHSIAFLDNNTILLNSLAEGNHYRGIIDWSGNVIIPTQFTKIKQITEDRYITNRETEWCIYNNKGNMLSKEKYVEVRDFKYSFEDFDIVCTVVYKAKQKINNYRVRFLQGGVIDKNGNELIPCIYDKVTLYPPHYALCVRNKIFTIVDFGENKQISFPKMDIKHVYYIDKLGRCLYSEDCVYNNKKEHWEGGTKGVLSIEGVIIPSGKYEEIHLLDNGLIRVGANPGEIYEFDNEDEYIVDVHSHYKKWGLLNQYGEIILPLEYTKISDFREGFATICQGGEFEYLSGKTEIRNGKWGVINDKGEFVEECIHDTESFYNLLSPLKIYNHPELITGEDCPNPQVVLSMCFDILPKSMNPDMEYMHGDWDDDEGGSGYTREELDQMYRDAFDNDPELEWNID